MILLIDNYDSFTWNLYQYFCELGAEVVVRRNDDISLAEIDALDPQKIVISPGPCTPSNRAFRWMSFITTPVSCPFLASAWATRPLGRCLVPPLCAPPK